MYNRGCRLFTIWPNTIDRVNKIYKTIIDKFNNKKPILFQIGTPCKTIML